jgi:hypothetical protein
MDNCDRIVEMVSRIDRRHAGVVAAEAFRSDQPLDGRDDTWEN